MKDLYEKLKTAIGVDELTINGKLQTTTVCPWCGSYSKKNDIKNSFGLIFNGGKDWGYKCFSCHETHSIITLALEVGVDGDFKIPERNEYSSLVDTSRVIPETPFWHGYIEELQDVYTGSDERYSAWWDYKRIPPEVVDKWGLGFGAVPWRESQIGDALAGRGSGSLITPIRSYSGSVVGFRARKPEGQWLSFSGLSLAMIPLQHLAVAATKRVIILQENYADGILVNEFGGPSVGAVSTLSTSYMSDAWIAALKYANPDIVVVAYDADVPGNGPVNREHLMEYVESRKPGLERMHNEPVHSTGVTESGRGWKASYKTESGSEFSITIPTPAGVRVSNMLAENRVSAILGKWYTDQKGKDIGQIWMESFDD